MSMAAREVRHHSFHMAWNSWCMKFELIFEINMERQNLLIVEKSWLAAVLRNGRITDYLHQLILPSITTKAKYC